MTANDLILLRNTFICLWLFAGLIVFVFMIWEMIDKKHFRNFFADTDGKPDEKDHILITVFIVVFTFFLCEIFGLVGFEIYKETHRHC